VSSWAHRVAATPRKYRAAGMEEESDWSDAPIPMASRPAASRTTGQSLCRSNSVSRAAGCAGHCRRSRRLRCRASWTRSRTPPARILWPCGSSSWAAPRELAYRDHGGPKLHTGRLAGVLRRAAQEIGYGAQGAPGTRDRSGKSFHAWRICRACIRSSRVAKRASSRSSGASAQRTSARSSTHSGSRRR